MMIGLFSAKFRWKCADLSQKLYKIHWTDSFIMKSWKLFWTKYTSKYIIWNPTANRQTNGRDPTINHQMNARDPTANRQTNARDPTANRQTKSEKGKESTNIQTMSSADQVAYEKFADAYNHYLKHYTLNYSYYYYHYHLNLTPPNPPPTCWPISNIKNFWWSKF